MLGFVDGTGGYMLSVVSQKQQIHNDLFSYEVYKETKDVWNNKWSKINQNL